ncbi:hypothetical protein MVES_001701 [Malassezia vespertilionis]|uniref:Thioesterase domain-containing protein n=1 Tax=Malassezia vespertilionis TaxID=2020962 RepID=A0A2N1JCZ2_9BASI|nr:hypothetical protein MVES_001701 [Malassezia vespertilionis]
MLRTVPLRSACREFVRNVHKKMMEIDGHDAHNTSHLVIDAARPGHISTSFAIRRENLNRAGTLHGGLVATLVDSVGSLAVASMGWHNTGVSTDISATFVKPAGREGDTVFATGTVVGMGKTLAYTRIELRDPATDALLVHPHGLQTPRECGI